jgi:hypothetical protein
MKLDQWRNYRNQVLARNIDPAVEKTSDSQGGLVIFRFPGIRVGRAEWTLEVHAHTRDSHSYVKQINVRLATEPRGLQLFPFIIEDIQAAPDSTSYKYVDWSKAVTEDKEDSTFFNILSDASF